MIYDILFPTVVARSSREDLVEPVKNIIQNLDVFEGWSGNANTDLHVLDGYPEIKQQFENEMRTFLHEKMGYGCELKMTTSWFTLMEPGMEGQMHYHRNSFYSGVYYYDDYDYTGNSGQTANTMEQLMQSRENEFNQMTQQQRR